MLKIIKVHNTKPILKKVAIEPISLYEPVHVWILVALLFLKSRVSNYSLLVTGELPEHYQWLLDVEYTTNKIKEYWHILLHIKFELRDKRRSLGTVVRAKIKIHMAFVVWNTALYRFQLKALV